MTARPPLARYQQIKRHITDRIQSGQWNPGTRLPSETELVQQMRVSRMTVHRALRELAAQGLLTRVQGVGTFVAAAQPHAELIELQDLADYVVQRGHTHRMKVVQQQAIRASSASAAWFNLRAGARLFQSVVVHYENDLPIQLEERHILPSFAPDYLQQDFRSVTPSRYLVSIAAPTTLEHVVNAIAPDRRCQRLLEIPAHEPCLLLTRRTWVGSTPVTHSTFVGPGSRYSLGGRFRAPLPR